MSSLKSDETESPLTPQTDDDEEWAYVPPDGGWGWLILSGTLLINMLIPGTIKSFGVLFVEFIEVFQTTPLVASWIPALCYFLYCSTGPLTTYLSIKTSYRAVTIAGGLFAAFGMVLSSFATSIVYLYVSFGVMVGLGAGLSFPPGIYLVTSYFVKYRGVANGLAISGSAIGSIIFPPFLRFLLETYGYRGAVLIMGGLTFNVMVGALLYDPVEMHLKRVKVPKEKLKGGGFELSTPSTASPDDDNNKLTSVVVRSAPSQKHSALESEQPLLRSPTDAHRKISAGSGFSNNKTGDYNVVRKISSCSYSGKMYSMGSQQISRKISASNKSPQRLGASMGHMPRNCSVASNMSSSSLRYVSTAFHGSTLASMANIHEQFSSNMAMRKEKGGGGFLCFGGKNETSTSEKGEKRTLQKWAKLLENPLFIVILISNATNAIGYTNFAILTPAYAIDLGYDKSKASYLLSIIATTDLIGRIGGASLSDFLKLNKKFYFIGGFLFSGIALILLPFFTNYTAMGCICALFGLASGSYVGITAVIMVELLGEKQLADSYGISLLVNGILQLIGPPICGAVFQRIQSYRVIVFGLGVTLVCGAAVWLVVPFLKKPDEK